MLIPSVKPDVVAIQEWNDQSERIVVGQDDHHFFLKDGELCIASRYPIRKVEDFTDPKWPMSTTAVARELETPFGKVPFINLRLASPHQPLEAVRWRAASAPDEVQNNSAIRLKQSQVISQYAAGLNTTVLLAGDFNTPEGRFALRQCWDRFSNAFEVAGSGFGHTNYSQRVLSRIDHIITGSSWRCRHCWVGQDIGSPHRPVIADLELSGSDR